MRLEYRPLRDEKIRLDVYLPSIGVAVELKYKTRRLEVELQGEPFALMDQRAHDNGRYDFLKDVQRLECVMKEGSVHQGIAILLTNDPLYWSRPSAANKADAEFQLEEGRELGGEMAWTTVKNRHERKAPIRLRGSYELAWREYAHVGSARSSFEPSGLRYGRFRYLAVELTCDCVQR